MTSVVRPSLRRTVVRGAMTQIWVQGVFAVAGMALVPILYRQIGALGYGLLALYGVVAAGLQLCDAGLSKWLRRNLPDDSNASESRSRQGRAIGAFLGAMEAIAVIIGLIGLLLWQFPGRWDAAHAALPIGVMIAIAALDCGLGSVTVIGQAFLWQRRDVLGVAMVSSGSSFVRMVFLIVGIACGWGLAGALALTAMRRPIEWAVLLWRVPTLRHLRPNWPSKEALGDAIRASSRLALPGVAQAATIPLVVLLAGRVGGLAAAGALRAALDVTGRLAAVPNAVGRVVFMAVIESPARGRRLLAQRLRRLRPTTLLLAVTAIAVLAWTVAWLGASSIPYARWIATLSAVTIAVVLAGVSAVLSEGLAAAGWTRWASRGPWLTLVAFALFALILQPATALRVASVWMLAEGIGLAGAVTILRPRPAR